MANMDPNRPVIVRTDESAQDFWSRPGSSEQKLQNNNFIVKGSRSSEVQTHRLGDNSVRLPLTINEPTLIVYLSFLSIKFYLENNRIETSQKELQLVERQKTPVPSICATTRMYNTQLELELRKPKNSSNCS